MKTTTTQKLLTGVLALQGLVLGGMFMSQPSAAQARGEVTLSNPSERQLQMIEELKAMNAKMDKLTSMLAAGEVTVKVAKDEK